MASEWAHVPLSELTETPVTYGVVQPGQEQPTGLPMLRVNNFRGHSLDLSEVMRISPEIEGKYKRTRIKAGDILLTIVGSVGQVAVVTPELNGWNIARAVAMIRPRDPDLSRWISLVLRSPKSQYQLGVAANTTVQTTINLKDLRELQIPLPEESERKAIAHILGTLDDKIELNRKQNQTLEAMARALFKAWFVDFEPVRAKTEGRWQRGQSLPGLPAHLYDLFPDRLVDSELGEIPEGWRHSTIGEEVTVCGGSTPSTKEPEFWEGGQHCWATPKDLSALKFPVLLDTDRKVTDAGLAKISSGLLPVGTVLLSSRAPIGYLAIAEVPTAINQGFIAMKCDGALPNVFVLQWCRESMDAIVGNANGSTFQEISKSNFRPLHVVVPSDPVLTSFTRLAVSLYRQLAENERESRSLAQLRDTLLPKLISGELRVGDVDKFLGGVI